MAARHIDEEAIFKFARKIASPNDRDEYLHQICGDDTALLARVEALLEVEQHEPKFLNVPPSGVDSQLVAARPAETDHASHHPDPDCESADRWE